MRAVLFDLDGVLIDSYEAWFQVVVGTARSFGAPEVTRERFRGTWGQGVAADLEMLYPGRTQPEVEAAYAREMAAQSGTIRVNPEARATLEALGARGLGRAVVTNTQIGLARAVLEASGLLAGFDRVEGVREGRREKPAPDMLLAALDALHTPPSEALMVGDSRFDEEAAAAAKVAFLHYDLRSGTSLLAALRARLGAG